MENGSPLSPDKPPVILDRQPVNAPKVETAQPARQEAPTPRVSSALKGLMDRERAIREQQESLKTLERDYHEAAALKRLASESPIDFLTRIGVTPDILQKQLGEHQNPDPNREIKDKLSKLERELQARQDREEVDRKQAALDEAQDVVRRFVDGTEAYPLIKGAGASELVYQTIYNRLETAQEALSEEDAAKEVEAYLETNFLDKWLSNPAIREKVLQKLGVMRAPVHKSPTLTNSIAAQNPTRVDTDGTLLPESKSIKRVAALLKYV